jgi:ABC transport system ATP-binding/permease protein
LPIILLQNNDKKTKFMSETVLDALIKLFALIGDIHDETVVTSREKDVVRKFLTRHLNLEMVDRYMKMFDEYLTLYNSESIKKGTTEDRKRISLNSMRILGICEKINEELEQKQKVYVLVKLIDYISLGEEITENELDFIQTVVNALYINESEYLNIMSFITESADSVPEKNRVLIIDNNKEYKDNAFKHLCNDNLTGTIGFLQIPSTNTYLMRYTGTEDIYLSGQNISAGETYTFDHGSSIRGSGINPVYYSEVVSIISEESFDIRISLHAQDVSFKFRNSENGIHHLNFHEESGKLVGILGGSGVGKSTTLSILNGTLKPQSGEVLINGYNLYDENDKKHLEGVIGYVPQDDLLIEELTVYQNLWYNARMCLNNLSLNKITEVVNKTLIDLDLEETRDLKVGSPLKKTISGGQRKRVNIALELIREPTILFVDEPTSGLSSVDSEMVMSLLKEQTYKGKLVIVNIHQPGSDLYKMFDRIMIVDKGGYQIYYGNPTEAIVYFKTHSNHANPNEDQCIKCGNINTDQLLQLVESKVVDERGKATRIRKVSPQEWAEKFRLHTKEINDKVSVIKKELPENYYSIPGLAKQSKIFFIRDLLSKIADRQYILISLLGPPLLALLLAHFTKYTEGSSYEFIKNENIPAYMFMSVVTSLFFGLMISSEEIVKDRKILKRESFLNLSWFSYMNSKILILFLISAIQTLLFTLIGNQILEIKGMTLSFWLILFTTSCTANILGLNISSAFNSVITIYIIIPFILIPQLLFSGVLVKFDKLHIGSSVTREYVPIIGDLMTARWSFEAMAVEQFKNNNYEKPFFKNDINLSQNRYYADYLIFRLKQNLRNCKILKDEEQYSAQLESSFKKLDHHIGQLSDLAGFKYPSDIKAKLSSGKCDTVLYSSTLLYLDSLKNHFNSKYTKALATSDSIYNSIVSKIGKDGMVELLGKYENERLRVIVTDMENLQKTNETGDRIIQKLDPIFMKATSKIGRAHFYAPYKKIGNLEVDTYWFNFFVIWFVSMLLYAALYFNLLRRFLTYFENLRFQKSET